MNAKKKPRQGNTSGAGTIFIVSFPSTKQQAIHDTGKCAACRRHLQRAKRKAHPAMPALNSCERHTIIDQLIKDSGGQLMRASDLKPGNSSNGGDAWGQQ